MGCKKSVAIIGAGPAGCASAYFADKDCDITLFDFARPLHTLLYTGGGRCNLAYGEFEFKELAKFYPRGEKFLYSIFSRFATGDTIDFFQKIGAEVYFQDDMRIFPTSNSAQEVREKVLHSIKDYTFKKEKVLKIESLSNCHAELVSASSQHSNIGKILNQVQDDKELKDSCGFSITTDYNSYRFDKVVIAVGGHAGFALAQNLGHTIIEPKPSLVALVTKKSFKALQGVCVKGVSAEVYFENKKVAQITDDILFTHNGISGPLTYKISSVCARLSYGVFNPLLIKLNFIHGDFDLQSLLNSNPKKDIKNLVSDYVPRSMAEFILKQNGIDLDEKCCNINGQKRDLIIKSLTEFEVIVNSPTKEGEVVTSGGVSLDEINPKTMESKLVENLYFCGEVIDVDGFCGGFNLQNCWSTGFVAGSSL